MERTTPTGHEASAPLVVSPVPRSLLVDAHLSAAARGVAVEALARSGRLNVAELASRLPETADEVLDAVGLLLTHGYAILTGETLEFTPAFGWPVA